MKTYEFTQEDFQSLIERMIKELNTHLMRSREFRTQQRN